VDRDAGLAQFLRRRDARCRPSARAEVGIGTRSCLRAPEKTGSAGRGRFGPAADAGVKGGKGSGPAAGPSRSASRAAAPDSRPRASGHVADHRRSAPP
jgi:hypothetical protein